MRRTTMALAFLVAWFVVMPAAWAQQYTDKEHAELAKALKAAKVSLQSGLQASAREGKPISACAWTNPFVSQPAAIRSMWGRGRVTHVLPGAGRAEPRCRPVLVFGRASAAVSRLAVRSQRSRARRPAGESR